MMKRILTTTLLAASIVACDPYGSYNFKSGAPAIKTVSLQSYGFGIGISGAPVTGSSAWTLDANCAAVAPLVCPNLPAGSFPIDGWDNTAETTPMTQVVLYVTFDRQVDGGTVQSAVDSCDPAGNWLTVTGATLGAGEAWQSCYSPGSPADYEGGSVVVYAAVPPTPGWGVQCSTTTTTNCAAELPDQATAPSIQFTGTVAGTAIDVTLNREDLTGCAACP